MKVIDLNSSAGNGRQETHIQATIRVFDSRVGTNRFSALTFAPRLSVIVFLFESARFLSVNGQDSPLKVKVKLKITFMARFSFAATN